MCNDTSGVGDSWSTVTSSNVSDQPPSYAETLNDDAARSQNMANENSIHTFDKGSSDMLWWCDLVAAFSSSVRVILFYRNLAQVINYCFTLSITAWSAAPRERHSSILKKKKNVPMTTHCCVRTRNPDTAWLMGEQSHNIVVEEQWQIDTRFCGGIPNSSTFALFIFNTQLKLWLDLMASFLRHCCTWRLMYVKYIVASILSFRLCCRHKICAHVNV